MNHLPNFKIEQICKKLVKIDTEILKPGKPMDDNKIRSLIDERRHLLALLDREIIAEGTSQNCLPTYSYRATEDLELFIDEWCNRIQRLNIQTVSFKCSNFCNLLFDHSLPRSWNFDQDLIIIHEPQSTEILEVARSRNQHHMIIFMAPDNIPMDVLIFAKETNTPITISEEHLKRTISLLQIAAKQVISISCENDPEIAQKAKATITEAVNNGKRTRTENTATMAKFGKSWPVNLLRNMSNFPKYKNLHQLNVSGIDDAIVVASGPSLSKNVDQLRDIQGSVFIVTALRSLPVLNSAGVQADLVIQLDAEDNEVAKKLLPDTSHPIKNLLLEATVNNGFFNIPAQNIIWSLSQHYFDIHQKFGTLPTPFNMPSVSLYGLNLCQFLGFKNICFVGQDLAKSSGKQYADGATDLLPAHADLSMFKIEVPGFFGGTVLTRSSYEFQIQRCTEIAQQWKDKQPDLNLVNATEGGAYIQNFDHMTLQAFIEQRQLLKKCNNKSIHFNQDFNVTDDKVAAYLRGIEDTLDKITKVAGTIIKLDSQEVKTRGLDKKIKKAVQKFQELNDSTSLLQIAMQQSIAEVIGTSRKVKTVDSYGQFFEKIQETATLLQASAKP